jgi:hypothetical protein
MFISNGNVVRHPRRTRLGRCPGDGMGKLMLAIE